MAKTSWKTIAVTAQESGAAALLALALGEGDSLTLEPAAEPARAALGRAGWAAKAGRWLDWIGPDGARLLVLGRDDTADRFDLLSLGGHLVEAMRALHIANVRLPASAILGTERFEALLTGACLHGYHHDQGRQKAAPADADLTLLIDPADQAIADRVALAVQPINRARAWVDQPANLLTPAAFAAEAVDTLTACGVTARVLGREELEAMGAGGVIAVGQGSHNQPCMLVAEWRGAPERAGWDAVLVGKGITFDAGGLNLKTRPIIEKMKLDMGGGAAVIGALEAAALRRSATNVAVIVPMAENSIGSNAYRPGDVIRMLSGQTVDVVNTDAEGRLVLADGVTYGLREYDPRHIVDVATLTGLLTGVLHEEYAGLFTTDDALAAALAQAGEDVGEGLWRLPMSKRLDYLVGSPVADMANLGAGGLLGIGGGSPVAGAKFIERFAQGRSWAHIDMAGLAWTTRRAPRAQAGTTGFGVALLDRWIAGLENSVA